MKDHEQTAIRRAERGSCSVFGAPPVPSPPTATRSSATVTHQAGNRHLRNFNRLRGPHAIYHDALDFDAHANRALCETSPSIALLASFAAPRIRPRSLHGGRAPLKLPKRTTAQTPPHSTPQTNEHRHSGM